MTTRDMLEWLSAYPLAVLIGLVALPALALICGALNGTKRPWVHLYAVLVYAACIPGLFAAVLIAYSLFLSHDNLLDANPLLYFGPVASMIATLVIIRRYVSFDALPGFDRLSGLMVLLAVSFFVVLAIDKTRIFIGFFGSIWTLLLLAAIVFLVLKWAAGRLFGRRKPDDEAPEHVYLEMPK